MVVQLLHPKSQKKKTLELQNKIYSEVMRKKTSYFQNSSLLNKLCNLYYLRQKTKP